MTFFVLTSTLATFLCVSVVYFEKSLVMMLPTLLGISIQVEMLAQPVTVVSSTKSMDIIYLPFPPLKFVHCKKKILAARWNSSIIGMVNMCRDYSMSFAILKLVIASMNLYASLSHSSLLGASHYVI